MNNSNHWKPFRGNRRVNFLMGARLPAARWVFFLHDDDGDDPVFGDGLCCHVVTSYKSPFVVTSF